MPEFKFKPAEFLKTAKRTVWVRVCLKGHYKSNAPWDSGEHLTSAEDDMTTKPNWTMIITWTLMLETGVILDAFAYYWLKHLFGG